MKLPLFYVARIGDRPWWSRRGWMLITPDEWEDLQRLKRTLEDWQTEQLHTGPCQCNDCVITEDDDPATRWRKVMRRLGLDGPT